MVDTDLGARALVIPADVEARERRARREARQVGDILSQLYKWRLVSAVHDARLDRSRIS